jgi:hypothetical protein
LYWSHIRKNSTQATIKIIASISIITYSTPINLRVE